MATSKKTVKAPEVKTLAQLQDDLAKALNELADARRSHAQGELVNPHILNTYRKAVARIKTAITVAPVETEEGKESK